MPTTDAQRIWTPLSLIEWSTEYLRSKQFDDPRLNAELLLAHVLRCKRIDLYLRFDQTLNENELAEFKLLFQRRLEHEPLQYIIGETEFMGLSLFVDRRVLIPRPETELLVERTLEGLSDAQKQYSVLDIGCGTGNIAISLARMHHHCVVDAMDISEDAVTVATSNVVRHQLSERIFIFTGDILRRAGQFIHQPYDVIVSNPPYISQKEFETLQPEISMYEPRSATTDDADGLTFYHAIATHGRSLLKDDGLLLVEIAYDQGEEVPRIFREAGYSDVTVYKDYNKLDRIVKGRKK